MGMFDEITNLEFDCPTCGEKITEGFQSKDGHCILAPIPYWQVDNFYGSCNNCDSWIEFNLNTKRQPLPLSDYKMTVETKDERREKRKQRREEWDAFNAKRKRI